MAHVWMQILSVAMLYCITEMHAQNWLLTCHVNGDAVSCPPHAHSGDHVTFNLKANQFEGYVLWKLPNGSCQGSRQPDTIVLSTTRGDCRRKRGFCGPFNATNIDPGHGSSCFQNNLSVIINSNSTHVIILEYGIQELNSNIIPVNSTEIHIHSGGIQSIPLPHTSVSSSADTRDSSVPPKATSTPYDLSFSTTTLPTETQSVKSESIDTVLITWSIIIFIAIFIAILIISVLICFCGARRLAIRGIVSNIVYVMQKTLHIEQLRNEDLEQGDLIYSKSAGKTSAPNPLATRINHINQLNPFNYGNKKLLEIIHEHWEDLAPKLIGDIKIKETARSMCGNTLMSVWLNSTKQQTKMNNPSVKRIAKSGKAPSQPTWGVLIEALKSIGLEDIGKHLENEINNKYK